MNPYKYIVLVFKYIWRDLLRFKKHLIEWLPFQLWVFFSCLFSLKKAVVICRCGALGDVVCTLPICLELRKLHPTRVIIFVTSFDYQDIVILSHTADKVYGSKYWNWGYSLPSNFNLFGLVTAVYNPTTTDERTKNVGATSHLIDDLAASCSLTLCERQPRLYPSLDLIQRTKKRYGLSSDAIQDRLIIGINGGPTWPIRTWDPLKWQVLIDLISSEYNAVVIQFGTNKSDGSSEFDRLTGGISVASRLKPDEIVALIAACDLVISIDSGPIHLAGAVGIPVVGLFGPVNPQYRMPLKSPGVSVCADVPCLFCHHKTPLGHWYTGCPNNILCMKKLDENLVFNAVKSVLDKKIHSDSTS